jgi:hypothetical protein
MDQSFLEYLIVSQPVENFPAFYTPQRLIAVPLHAMEALEGRGGMAPTHSRPRH